MILGWKKKNLILVAFISAICVSSTHTADTNRGELFDISELGIFCPTASPCRYKITHGHFCAIQMSLHEIQLEEYNFELETWNFRNKFSDLFDIEQMFFSYEDYCLVFNVFDTDKNMVYCKEIKLASPEELWEIKRKLALLKKSKKNQINFPKTSGIL